MNDGFNIKNAISYLSKGAKLDKLRQWEILSKSLQNLASDVEVLKKTAASNHLVRDAVKQGKRGAGDQD